MMRKLMLLLLALTPLAGMGGCAVVAEVPGPTVVWTAEPQMVAVEGAPDVYYCPGNDIVRYGGYYYWYSGGSWYYSQHWNGGFVACTRHHVPRAILRVPERHPVYQRMIIHHPDYKPPKPPPPRHVNPPPGHVNPPPGHVNPPPRRDEPPGHVNPPPRRDEPPGHVNPPPRRGEPPGHVNPPPKRDEPPPGHVNPPPGKDKDKDKDKDKGPGRGR